MGVFNCKYWNVPAGRWHITIKLEGGPYNVWVMDPRVLHNYLRGWEGIELPTEPPERKYLCIWSAPGSLIEGHYLSAKATFSFVGTFRAPMILSIDTSSEYTKRFQFLERFKLDRGLKHLHRWRMGPPRDSDSVCARVSMIDEATYQAQCAEDRAKLLMYMAARQSAAARASQSSSGYAPQPYGMGAAGNGSACQGGWAMGSNITGGGRGPFSP